MHASRKSNSRYVCSARVAENKLNVMTLHVDSGALRTDYFPNCEAVYITVDSYYDLDTW